MSISEIIKLADHIKANGSNANFIIKSEYYNWDTWGRFHDAVLESIGLDLSIVDCVVMFHNMPAYIQNLAYDWGFNDTVFGDEVFQYAKDHKNELMAKFSFSDDWICPYED